MRYAMVHDASGIVVNVVGWDGDTARAGPPEGYVMVLDEPPAAGPGYSWDGTTFTPPPPMVAVVEERNEKGPPEEPF